METGKFLGPCFPNGAGLIEPDDGGKPILVRDKIFLRTVSGMEDKGRYVEFTLVKMSDSYEAQNVRFI